MKTITIRSKLMLLGATATILLLVNGFIIYYTIQSLNYQFDIRYSIQNLSELTLQLRKHEKDFLLREVTNDEYFKSGKSKYVDSLNSIVAVITKNIQNYSKSEFFIDNNLTIKLQQINDFYKSYQQNFNDIVKAHNVMGFKDYGVEGEMRNASSSLEKYGNNTFAFDKYLISLLSLRRHEKDFLIRKDLDYKDKFEKEFINFIQIINSAGLASNQLRTEALENANNYKNNFYKLIDNQIIIGLTENDGLLKELRANVRNVEPAIASITEEINSLIILSQNRTIAIALIIFLIGITIIIATIYFVVNSIMAILKDASDVITKLSHGDFSFDFQVKTQDEIGKMLSSLLLMKDKLKDCISQVILGNKNIVAASTEISTTSQQLAQSASEQAASVEEISASVEQMASNIQQNTDNAQQTDKIATKAVEDILSGNKAVTETIISMKTIVEKVKIISEIANKTDLLAINAAIEAARAGEQGKGFGVVASEVRKLADRSQKAATEIDELTKMSLDIAENTGKLFTEIVLSIQNTAQLVQEITASSIEQNSGAIQINSTIAQLNKVVQQSAAASEELATCSEEMTSQSEQVNEIVSFFKVDAHIKNPETKQPKVPQQIKYGITKQENKFGVDIQLEDEKDNEFQTY